MKAHSPCKRVGRVVAAIQSGEDSSSACAIESEGAMGDLMLLVDLENIHCFDLGKAPPNARIKIFVGQTQSKLPTALVQQAQAQIGRAHV